MKNSLTVRHVVFAMSCSTLLLGCQGSAVTADPEAKLKCSNPPPTNTLPARFEAEEVMARVSPRGSLRIDRDLAASNKKVSEARFFGQDKKLTYSLLTYNKDEAEVWVRIRKGPDQGVYQAWVDDGSASAVTIDGYSTSEAFAEVMIGKIPAQQSKWGDLHSIRMQVTGKSPSSSGYGITADFIELRALSQTSPCQGKPDGTACDDGNACTRTDQCQSQACVGSNPVVCGALDSCHTVGTCDTASGQCSNPIAADDTVCDDGNGCTQTDRCSGGACVGRDPVTCQALDACHVAGTCDATTGACSNPTAPDHTPCNDGNLCTQTDACVGGACVGHDPVACPYVPTCLTQGVCAPDTGLCSAASNCSATCGNGQRDDSEACDDGNRYPGDGCNEMCQSEQCGDHILQPAMQYLAFQFDGRSCGLGGAKTITFRLNGTAVAQGTLPDTCACQPGIQTLQVTNPALRALGTNGVNQLELETDGELAWAMAIIYTRTLAVSQAVWGASRLGEDSDLCANPGSLAVVTGTASWPLTGGEECDDGNIVGTDGCSSQCLVEPGWDCTSGVCVPVF